MSGCIPIGFKLFSNILYSNFISGVQLDRSIFILMKRAICRRIYRVAQIAPFNRPQPKTVTRRVEMIANENLIGCQSRESAGIEAQVSLLEIKSVNGSTCSTEYGKRIATVAMVTLFEVSMISPFALVAI